MTKELDKNLIMITKEEYPSQYKLLSIMELDIPYSEPQLQDLSELTEYIVRNTTLFLRKILNFVYNGEIHHFAISQFSKRSFHYILKKGLYTIDSDYFLPNE